MKAVVLSHTGTPGVLHVSEVSLPSIKSGWVLIKIKAFGLNRSELMMRAYEANEPYIKLPRILGIECVGEIADGSDTGFHKGQKVIALMGGMGRSFDGSYAEYALLPAKNVFTVDTDFSWEELAAIPETYFTAWGSLFESLQLKADDILLVRGGTSAAGLAAIQLAKTTGASVLASTRKKEKSNLLLDAGADHVVIDNGKLKLQVMAIFPKGITKVLELIGPATLSESLSMVKKHGIVCMTGILGKKSIIDNFYPIKDIPSGVYLTGFSSNTPTQEAIDKLFTRIKEFHLKPRIAAILPLEEIAQAHQLMEDNQANGKVIINIH